MGNTPNYKPGLNFKMKLDKAEQARFDSIGLCLALLQDQVAEHTTGQRGFSETRAAMIGEMIDEPERIGGCLLTLVGMIRDLADARPGGFALLCDSLVDAIPERA